MAGLQEALVSLKTALKNNIGVDEAQKELRTALSGFDYESASQEDGKAYVQLCRDLFSGEEPFRSNLAELVKKLNVPADFLSHGIHSLAREKLGMLERQPLGTMATIPGALKLVLNVVVTYSKDRAREAFAIMAEANKNNKTVLKAIAAKKAEVEEARRMDAKLMTRTDDRKPPKKSKLRKFKDTISKFRWGRRVSSESEKREKKPVEIRSPESMLDKADLSGWLKLSSTERRKLMPSIIQYAEDNPSGFQRELMADVNVLKYGPQARREGQKFENIEIKGLEHPAIIQAMLGGCVSQQELSNFIETNAQNPAFLGVLHAALLEAQSVERETDFSARSARMLKSQIQQLPGDKADFLGQLIGEIRGKLGYPDPSPHEKSSESLGGDEREQRSALMDDYQEKQGGLSSRVIDKPARELSTDEREKLEQDNDSQFQL